MGRGGEGGLNVLEAVVKVCVSRADLALLENVRFLGIVHEAHLRLPTEVLAGLDSALHQVAGDNLLMDHFGDVLLQLDPGWL
jgi:hypothetical protein